MEFRAQFFLSIFGYLLWAGVSLLFLEAIFGNVSEVRGWTRPQMWVLYGTFVVLESLVWGLLGPNMWRFSSMVRDGELDLVLIKPVNAQFFVSTRYIDLNAVLNVVPGIVLMIYGLRVLGVTPTLGQCAIWLLLLSCALLMAYCFWFFIVTWAIWIVRFDGVAILIDPMVRMAQFPIQIYPGRLQTFLVSVLPVAFFSTFPTQSLLGTLDWRMIPLGLFIAGALLLFNRLFFNFALRFYGSASS